MEQLNEPTEAAVLQLQKMLNTPIEDQAATYELMPLEAFFKRVFTRWRIPKAKKKSAKYFGRCSKVRSS